MSNLYSTLQKAANIQRGDTYEAISNWSKGDLGYDFKCMFNFQEVLTMKMRVNSVTDDGIGFDEVYRKVPFFVLKLSQKQKDDVKKALENYTEEPLWTT